MQIHYVSGSRADFGLMEKCLQHLHRSSDHTISILATGQHLIEKYGRTIDDVHASGLPVVGEIPVSLSGASGAEMGYALASELVGFIDFWEKNRPDLVLLLGDRGEMLAAAIAAVHLGIHIGHIHGGENTGTLDDSFRHAITRLSHLHFPATENAASLLRAMGEPPETIYVIGAPGLVGVTKRPEPDRNLLRSKLGLTAAKPLALCIYHPVVQESTTAAQDIKVLVQATQAAGYALVLLRPNSDAGGRRIDAYLDDLQPGDDLQILTHLSRDDFLDLISASDIMVGNSSSGIIESASFGIPCINVGSRQIGRQRNQNTFDVQQARWELFAQAFEQARAWTRTTQNVYGDGLTHERLKGLLDEIDLTPELLVKKLTL